MGSRVQEFYDANTWKFVLTGSRRAIHRELWGPGVTSRREALDHVHELVLDELGAGDRRVLDLGCGVGGAALHLAERASVEVVGVSISPAQVRLARRYAGRAGPLRGSVGFEVSDFTALPPDLTGFDLAFAIESFVHADPAASFFGEAARTLRPGGALVVVDDFLTGESPDPRLEDFRSGWHAPSLVSVQWAEELATHAGLELAASRDLSPLQRLGRPRDRVVHSLQPVLRRLRSRSPWAQAMVGGDALQAGHRAGLLEYRLLRFVRPG
jgi:cyclopropane fatty-acyl-phospholipid synthase-like methyltransferase